MNYESLKDGLRGVLFTTTTPFDESGRNVLHEEIERNTRAVLDAGGRTFIPCGNTGEFHSLTREERLSVVETTAETVGDDGIVVAGTGGSTKDAIEQIAAYEEAGVDGVMIHGLDHTYRHRKGVAEYYRTLAESTDLGIVLYKRSPVPSIPVIAELSTIDNVVGAKFAVNDIDEFSRAVRDVPGDIVFCNGIAERFAPAFAIEGAEGFTTGVGSFVPNATLALQEALERGEWERARNLRDLLRPLEDIRTEPGADNVIEGANNVPVVKYGLELAGRYGGPVREPIVGLSAEDEARVEDHYRRIEQADIVSASAD